MTAAWYCTHYCRRRRWYRWQFATPVANLPPVSLTPVANLPPVSTTLAKLVEKFAAGVADTGGKFAAGVVDTGGNFAAGVIDTGGKFATRCRWYRWCTLTCDYLREFSKKFETVLMQYSGAGGKLIHQKNQKQKISWHCPFKEVLLQKVRKQTLPSLRRYLFRSTEMGVSLSRDRNARASFL